jgi:type I restriction enzyme R subunit
MSTSRPAFRPFDEHRATRVYQRSMPHWRQDGATYFVTFRLGDSIPEGIRRQWQEEQTLWLKARGIVCDGEEGRWATAFAKLPAREQFLFQQHFNRQVQSCLDRGIGSCHLRNRQCTEIVRSKLFADDGNRHHLGDFVIMPNHVHLLITPAGDNKLELILKQIKGASAVECNRLLQRSGTFWQSESYDHIVRSVEQLLAYRTYIADNPRKAGITRPHDACHSADWMDAWLGA